MDSPRLKVVVSVINYKTAELTKACVESVLAVLPDEGARVVIVDNFSDDGSVEALTEWMKTLPQDGKVELIASETNTGFSGGHNIGMGAHQADYYLVLNSDAVIKDGFFESMLARADAEPDVGLFAPKILYDDGTQQISLFRFHTPASEFIRSVETTFISRLLDRWIVWLGTDPDPNDIEWASFACILLRGEMVRELGPMDEGYFLYFEDVEYAMRARRAGWGISYVPDAEAVHFRGGSGPVKSLASQRAALPRYYYCSRTRFLYQAHGRLGLLAANLVWYPARLIKNATRLLGKKITPAVKNEGRDNWTNFFDPLGPRQ